MLAPGSSGADAGPRPCLPESIPCKRGPAGYPATTTRENTMNDWITIADTITGLLHLVAATIVLISTSRSRRDDK